MADKEDASSVEVSADRWWIWAPFSSARLRISWWSDDTHMESKPDRFSTKMLCYYSFSSYMVKCWNQTTYLAVKNWMLPWQWIMDLRAHNNNGVPFSFLRFFNGMPLLPPRAKIRPATCIIEMQIIPLERQFSSQLSIKRYQDWKNGSLCLVTVCVAV